MWITGGQTSEHVGGCCWIQGSKKSTEFITSPGPELPFKIHSHCMVQVCPNTIYIISGIQEDNKKSNHTWILDAANNSNIISGPPLRRSRFGHSCNKMENNGNFFFGSSRWS